MVESTYELDAVFQSLSDRTRRDILRRVRQHGMSVGAIANNYRLTFAAVAKHLAVLERAGLVYKTRRGKEQIVTIAPDALAAANAYLENYRDLWEQRLDRLGAHVAVSSTKR